MRHRLLLWLIVPLVSLSVLSTVVASQIAMRVGNDLFDSFLFISADSVAARVVSDDENLKILDAPPSTSSVLRHYGRDRFYYQIVDENGVMLSGDTHFPEAELKSQTSPNFRDASINGEQVRLCRVHAKMGGRTVWVRVAETLNTRHQMLAGIFWGILIPQLALVTLGCVSVWYGVTRNLRPLNVLSRVLSKRTKPDFSLIDIGPVPLELKPVTDALNQLFSAASKQMQSQRNFVANAAHQMRTPLTATKTYLEYLLKNENRPHVTETLSHLDSTVDRSVLLINRLLILARAEGEAGRTASKANLIEAVHEAAKSLVHQSIADNIDLTFDLPDEEVLIPAEHQDLREVIINLLDNAIKYTPAGGEVTVTVTSEGSRAVLTVQDNGPGIIDSEKERVFERFYRSSRNSVAGSGIGLSIVKEITLALGGTIELRDRYGGGTIVCVALPRIASSVVQNESTPQVVTSIS
jgi:two-component system sensor histidine kinase TctE